MQNAISTSLYSPAPLPGKLRSITLTGFISITIGSLVLTGWIFHIAILQAVLPKFVSMKVNTAIEFILVGFALLVTQFKIRKSHLIIARILYLTVIVIGFASLIESIFQFNLDIDELFFADTAAVNQHLSYPGRMSLITAVCFILLGCSFWGFTTKSNINHIISQYCLNFVTAISAVAIIGYLYGLSSFYSISYAGSIPIHTAFLLFLISLTASWLQPSIGINELFAGKLVGNVMAKRVLIIAVFIILFFGILSLIGRHFKLFSFKNGMSLLIIGFICAGFVMVWNMARWMNKLDTGRRDAETEVALMNDQLELRVKQRSDKLTILMAKYRETEAKFKAAFEHSAIGTALVTLKGKWFQVNRSLCDMMGYKEQELLTMSIDSIYGDNRMVNPHQENELSAIFSNPGKIERRYKCKDKSIVWISVNTAAVNNKKGGAIYFVSQFEDITNRKNAEINLKAAYKDIENHVKTIQGLAWKQSHMIRRPLANLQGLTGLLKDDNLDSEVLVHIEKELIALDKIIIEMAEDARCKGIKKIVAKKRSFKKPVKIT
ncbi:PAS domain S-box-containing protein [Mucilaginibacter sp. UYP25]